MTVRFTKSEGLLRIILEDAATPEDLFAGVDEIYRGVVPKLILWDFSNSKVDENQDAAEQLKALSAYAVERGKYRDQSRVALLTPDNAQYGLGRMSTALAENNKAAYNMAVFRDEDEALAWLNAKDL